jgi:hypothetical protein
MASKGVNVLAFWKPLQRIIQKKTFVKNREINVENVQVYLSLAAYVARVLNRT